MLIGAWKSFEDLEESLTLEELNEILDGIRRNQHSQMSWIYGAQGVRVDPYDEPEEEKSTFGDVLKRVRAKTNKPSIADGIIGRQEVKIE